MEDPMMYYYVLYKKNVIDVNKVYNVEGYRTNIFTSIKSRDRFIQVISNIPFKPEGNKEYYEVIEKGQYKA